MKEIQQVASEKNKIEWHEIEHWIDDDLVLYIQKNLKVCASEAVEILQETKKFLLVANNNYTENNNLSPSPSIDEAWHCFILFTPIYRDFCENLLKRNSPIPHIPNVGRWSKIPPKAEGDINDSYGRTVEAIEREIGPVNSKYWPDPRTQGYGLSCRSCCTPCKAV